MGAIACLAHSVFIATFYPGSCVFCLNDLAWPTTRCVSSLRHLLTTEPIAIHAKPYVWHAHSASRWPFIFEAIIKPVFGRRGKGLARLSLSPERSGARLSFAHKLAVSQCPTFAFIIGVFSSWFKICWFWFAGGLKSLSPRHVPGKRSGFLFLQFVSTLFSSWVAMFFFWIIDCLSYSEFYNLE